MIIKSVLIKNFRSIVSEKVQLNDIVVFVGNNDAGKSNYLKALNLFFNNQTDFNNSFNFQNDFCKNSTTSRKMAAEITITLEIVPPVSYKANKNIIWTKIYRNTGLFGSTKTYPDKSSIETAYSRINHWLDHLKFRYVPATKSNNYFQELLGDLHDTLAKSIEKEILLAASSFTEKIQESTNEITKELASRIGLESILKLPQDLRSIFQTLNFQTKFENFELSLNNRGDGIKARHIPIILKFLAEQDNRTRSKGAPRIDTIWGFEEPENNLELTKAFDLAKDFYDYSSDIQLLLTTHSSAFYGIKTLNTIFSDLKNFDSKKINTYYVEKNIEEKNSSRVIEIENDINKVNEKLGLMPLITPFIIEKVKENIKLHKSIEEIKSEFQNQNTPIIVLEGLSDKIILEKSIQLFDDKLNDAIKQKKISILAKESAGVNWVSDFIKAWFYLRKDYKVLALLDHDEAGIKCKKELLENDTKCKNKNVEGLLKVIHYDTPEHLYNVIKKGIKISITLEELYTLDVWKYSKENSYLDERKELQGSIDEISLFTSVSQHLNEILNINEDEILYCLHKISKIYKGKVTKYILDKSDEELKIILKNFEKTVKKISDFFIKN